jgi:hypothetical protein
LSFAVTAKDGALGSTTASSVTITAYRSMATPPHARQPS